MTRSDELAAAAEAYLIWEEAAREKAAAAFAAAWEEAAQDDAAEAKRLGEDEPPGAGEV